MSQTVARWVPWKYLEAYACGPKEIKGSLGKSPPVHPIPPKKARQKEEGLRITLLFYEGTFPSVTYRRITRTGLGLLLLCYRSNLVIYERECDSAHVFFTVVPDTIKRIWRKSVGNATEGFLSGVHDAVDSGLTGRKYPAPTPLVIKDVT